MKLVSYSEYRDSGVPWLGRIPAHWEVRKLKFSSKMIAGGATPASGESELWDGDIVWVTPQDVSKNERLNSSSRNLTSAGVASCSAVLVPPGSIVVTSRAPVGNVAFAEVELCTNQGCKAFVPDERYLLNEYSLILLKAMQPVFQKAANGTTFLEISTWAFENIKTPLPPLEEQTQIARFLDSKTAQIDKFIRNKQRLIQLLKEQKQNVINQAVTRGLDPNVKLKPSGVEWLGDIPEHWEVAPLKHLAKINARVLPESTDENYAFDYFDIASVGTGYLTVKPETLRFGQAPSRARRVLKKGDTLLSTVRTYLKAMYYVPAEVEDWIASTGFAVLTPKKEIHPPFLGLLIQSENFINRVIRESIGVAYPAIAEKKLSNLHLAYPVSFKEQQRIQAHIVDHSKAINQAITRAQREIELIHEYRARLISDVVTGQVDVRGIEVSELAEEALPLLDEGAVESNSK